MYHRWERITLIDVMTSQLERTTLIDVMIHSLKWTALRTIMHFRLITPRPPSLASSQPPAAP
jgi:hypothetical protein